MRKQRHALLTISLALIVWVAFMESESVNVLVIRHELCSGLGMLQSAVLQRDATFQYLETPQGDRLTHSLSDYSHLVILGGPASAYESDIYPYLKYEFGVVEQAIAQGIPTLGICLGSQILAHVLGAKVYRGERGREAGWCDMHLTEAGQIDPLFQDFPTHFQVFESHQDTFDLPSGCTHLAYSDLYPNQAFRYQDHVWSMQFHLEIDHNVLNDCAAIIKQELEESQLEGVTVEQLIEEARHHSPAVAPLAEQFMHQFLRQTVKQPAYF
jgi:GMP synthase (glutamine-hydrolysing)